MNDSVLPRQSSLATPEHRCTRRYSVRIRASVFKAQHRPGTRHRRPLSNRPQTDATPEKQRPTATRQFSPRKLAPRFRLLLVGEATRIGLVPRLSSRNDKTRRLKSKAVPPLASSRRESSHRELQAFCRWAKLLELG